MDMVVVGEVSPGVPLVIHTRAMPRMLGKIYPVHDCWSNVVEIWLCYVSNDTFQMI